MIAEKERLQLHGIFIPLSINFLAIIKITK